MRYVLYRKPLHASAQLLNELSTPLRTEIMLHMHRETIQNVPFLRDKDPHFVVALVSCLQHFAPGDVVVRQGDVGDSMFFVGKGELEV
jgi:CRP-like cAMP-binding protein